MPLAVGSNCVAPLAIASRPAARRARATALVPVAHKQQSVEADVASRRGALSALGASVLFAAAVSIPAGPAYALFGAKSAEENYADDTGNMISRTQYLLSLARDDPAKADAVKEVRSLTNV